MIAFRLSRRARRIAALVAVLGLPLAGAGNVALAQQPRTSYSQRAAIFDPRGHRIGKGTRTVPPAVRQRPAVHRSYFADQRSGTYENRSIPSARARTPGARTSGNSGMRSPGALMGMAGMTNGLGLGSGVPGMDPGSLLYGQRGGGAGGGGGTAGRYGGARPR